MIETTESRHPAREDLAWFLRQARPRKLRSMREFAEQEIVIPDGPFAGRRFRCYRQPYTGLWFDAIDSGQWSRYVATGPTQSGKTLSCFVIPLLYHLFEIGETVICGLPDMDMAADKWREDILPAIEQANFRDLLPKRGGGSRGGRVESLKFANGATLKFMSGGGGDKSRAGFTSRVVVITETDGMDQPGAASRESDKITQLEARTRAYGNRKRIYMECTVSTEEGRTWQEYRNSTESRIVAPCRRCGQWVSPEREHLVGWQGAASQAEARAAGVFVCPSCKHGWNHDHRVEANRRAKLLHKGQAIDAGQIEGELAVSDTLGFRWSAVNNLFASAGDVAADEWRASRATDEENAEREMRQFVWCVPVAPTKWEESAVDAHELTQRMNGLPRGVVPAGTFRLTAGIDLGKYLAHWIVVAWKKEANGHIVDYGRIEVASEDLGVEKGILVALRDFRNLARSGWPVGNPNGEVMTPHQTWIDAGYMTPVVYAFCREAGAKQYRPAVGRGVAQQHRQWYNRPKSTGAIVKHIGEGYHSSLLRGEGLQLIEVDADHWKTWVHGRLTSPMEAAGAMTLFQATPSDHLALAKHLTAERKTEEFVAGKGVATKWERVRRQNHWFDALYNAAVAGHFAGVRLVSGKQKAPSTRPTLQQLHEGWEPKGSE